MANGRILGKFSWFRMPDEKLKNKVAFKWLKRVVRLGGEWIARKGIMVIRVLFPWDEILLLLITKEERKGDMHEEDFPTNTVQKFCIARVFFRGPPGKAFFFSKGEKGL